MPKLVVKIKQHRSGTEYDAIVISDINEVVTSSKQSSEEPLKVVVTKASEIIIDTECIGKRVLDNNAIYEIEGNFYNFKKSTTYPISLIALKCTFIG